MQSFALECLYFGQVPEEFSWDNFSYEGRWVTSRQPNK